MVSPPVKVWIDSARGALYNDRLRCKDEWGMDILSYPRQLPAFCQLVRAAAGGSRAAGCAISGHVTVSWLYRSNGSVLVLSYRQMAFAYSNECSIYWIFVRNISSRLHFDYELTIS